MPIYIIILLYLLIFNMSLVLEINYLIFNFIITCHLIFAAYAYVKYAGPVFLCTRRDTELSYV